MRRRRATLALTTSLAVGAVLVLAPVPPAQAAVAIASSIHQVGTSFGEAGTDTCTVANPSDSTMAPFYANGVTSTQSVSSSTTIIDDGDAADVTNATASSKSTMRATHSGNTFLVDWQTTLKETINQVQPTSDCDAQASATAVFTYQANVDDNAWFTLQADVDPGTTVTMFVIKTSPGGPPVQEVFIITGPRLQATFELLLPPGSYIVQGVVQQALAAPEAPGDPTSAASSNRILSTYRLAGTATGSTIGPAAKYLTLADRQACATGALNTNWTTAAGQGKNRTVKKAVFFVNGDKVKTVKRPRKGQTTTLKNLPATDALAVKVKLKLAAGGRQVLTRSYLSCS